MLSLLGTKDPISFQAVANPNAEAFVEAFDPGDQAEYNRYRTIHAGEEIADDDDYRANLFPRP